MLHPFPHLDIGARSKSYTPHAKERHGKGWRLRGLASGEPLLLAKRPEKRPSKAGMAWKYTLRNMDTWADPPRQNGRARRCARRVARLPFLLRGELCHLRRSTPLVEGGARCLAQGSVTYPPPHSSCPLLPRHQLPIADTALRRAWLSFQACAWFASISISPLACCSATIGASIRVSVSVYGEGASRSLKAQHAACEAQTQQVC